MATTYIDQDRNEYSIDDGLESIVVIKDLGDLPGGVILADTAGAALDADECTKAGNLIIKVVNDTTGETRYAPLGVTDGAYDALPEIEGSTASYVGVLKASIANKEPFAAVLTMGQVNDAACPAPVTDAIKAELINIQFI